MLAFPIKLIQILLFIKQIGELAGIAVGMTIVVDVFIAG